MVTRQKKIQIQFFEVVSASGVLLSVLVWPWVFTKLFSMQSLFSFQQQQLKVLSLGLLVVSILLFLGRKKLPVAFSFFLFVIYLFCFNELAARFLFNKFASHEVANLAKWSNHTYPGLMAYTGHPFAQFIGNPSVNLIGNDSLKGIANFNNFGFSQRDYHYHKPDTVVRIVAMGGSTTASGYPAIMEKQLNNKYGNPEKSFEVLSFAHGWYNSAHLLSHFIFSVLDFKPDVLVLHTGWNERFVRNAEGEFRSDYSHALKTFTTPAIPDRYLIRWSVVYRYIKFKLFTTPDWLFLENATLKKFKKDYQNRWGKMHELRPFKRNLQNIIHLAKIHKIKVILSTQPYNSDSTKHWYFEAPHIQQCNNIVRELAKDNPEVTLLDMDQMLTGKRDRIFRDLAHVNQAGLELKAELTGNKIISLMGLGQ